VSPPIRVGLRIDVDTLRGTRDGVPKLLESLGHHEILATFFFSVGPDNMGRHLRRLARPDFVLKMLRSHAPSLYGWETLLRGTFGPGPVIGERLAHVIRAAAEAGHEIGLHAWDHHAWQTRLARMTPAEIRESLRMGWESLEKITGAPPSCSAVAGWICDERTLREKEAFHFRFNSDCRGESIFRPILGAGAVTPQIPVTLPTYDEIIGRDGLTDDDYNGRLFALLRPDRLNVLTIHAEVEGIARADLFDRFLESARERGVSLVALGELLGTQPVADDRIVQAPIPGRDGDVCWQASARRPSAASAWVGQARA
jgi:undecaprenyl phosphate-alpha-L-ara4FN deformylase